MSLSYKMDVWTWECVTFIRRLRLLLDCWFAGQKMRLEQSFGWNWNFFFLFFFFLDVLIETIETAAMLLNVILNLKPSFALF